MFVIEAMMLQYLVATAYLLLFVSPVYCAPTALALEGNETSSLEETQLNDTNSYVDDIIDAFRDSLGNKLDPLKIPDKTIGFDRKMLGIRFHGKLLRALSSAR